MTRPSEALPPFVKVDRLYQPRGDALDALAHVLQVLLLDDSELLSSSGLPDKNRLAFLGPLSEECV